MPLIDKAETITVDDLTLSRKGERVWSVPKREDERVIVAIDHSLGILEDRMKRLLEFRVLFEQKVNKEMSYSLGRLRPPDLDLDRDYPLRGIMQAPVTARTYRHWPTGWVGDQGATPTCVGYSTAAWLECSPVRHKEAGPFLDPTAIYRGAQDNDEWPGSGYDGTSVRGAFKFLHKAGYITAYHWAQSIADVTDYLLHQGPIVLGIDWYESSFHAGPGDIIEFEGAVVGGHAILVAGINMTHGVLRVVNSWGQDWAGDGRAWMRIEDADRLLFQQGGEACAGVEAV